MTAENRPSRAARVAVSALTGGLLAVIWSGVWYAAIRTNRYGANSWQTMGCAAAFAAGLLAAVGGLLYLRLRGLSITDGSHMTPSLPAGPLPADRPTHPR